MFLTTFLYSQLFVTPTFPKEDLTGKTVIVTGSNTGLGLEAARHFAELNCAKLIIAVRTISKGQSAKESILASTGRKDDFIEIWELDMSDNASVKAFVSRVNKDLDRLDILVENAGVMMASHQTASSGYEQVIQVNVIATFLLALLALPKLRETAKKYSTKTNLAIVSSEAHHLTTVEEADEPDTYAALSDDKRPYVSQSRYYVSKALEVLFVRQLIKHTSSTPIITLVNPGMCKSEFFRDVANPAQYAALSLMQIIFARSTEVGSRTLVAGGLAGPKNHGQYMADSDNQEVAGWMRSARGVKVQKKVYDETMAALEKIEPGISSKL